MASGDNKDEERVCMITDREFCTSLEEVRLLNTLCAGMLIHWMIRIDLSKRLSCRKPVDFIFRTVRGEFG